MSKLAAIPALVIFVLGVALTLPSEANIGVMIIEAMDDSLCSDDQSQNNVACQKMGMYIWALRIIGILMVVGDIYYIYSQFKEGNVL